MTIAPSADEAAAPKYAKCDQGEMKNSMSAKPKPRANSSIAASTKRQGKTPTSHVRK